MRITLQTLLDQPRKAWKAAAHIGVTGCKPHPRITRNGNHRRSSTSRTRASASGSTCASTRMRRRLPRSISINPIRAATTDRARLSLAGKSFGASPASVAAICTGAKDGTTCSDVRACRRQVNTRLAATPLRRATAVTSAPGANVSSTIRALSSCDQRRRRSSPPKPRPASPDNLKAILKVTRLTNFSVPDKAAAAGCVP